MIFSENRFSPRIKSGHDEKSQIKSRAGFFGIML